MVFKSLPNLLTLANLFLGCLAVVYILQDNIYINLGEESVDGVRYISALGLGKIPVACLLVFAAALIDLLDGFLARFLKAESQLGKQLDSLADVVTFGLVPGLIMYHLLAVSWFSSANALAHPTTYFLPAFAITLAAGWRLARFNASGSDTHFRGLPTPAVALVVASLPLSLHFSEGFTEPLMNKWLLYALTGLLSLLMISRLPVAKPGAGHMTWIFLGLCAALLLVAHLVAGVLFVLVPAVVLLYILYSLVISSKESNTTNP